MAQSHKKLGFAMLLTLMIGNMIGVGIFLLPVSMANIGSISIYGWVFAGIGALLLALVYARISMLVPKAGGPYAYAHVGFGEFIGFQTVYGYWISVMIGNAATALGVAAYLRPIFPSLNNPGATCIIAIASIWLITLVNVLGLRPSGMVQIVTTVIKVVPFLLILALGWHYFHPDLIQFPMNVSGHSNLSAITMATVLAFWGFLGLESATVSISVAENPRRNIPLATLLGTLFTALLYIAVIVLVMGIIPLSVLQHSTSPFNDLAHLVFGDWSKWIIVVWAVIACLGSLNGWRLIQGQMAYAAAENNMFPHSFFKLNRFAVPAKGMIIAAICETIVLLLTEDNSLINQFNILIVLATFALLLPYFNTCLAQIFILKQVPKLKIRAWFHLIIAAIAAIFTFWLIFNCDQQTIYYGAILLLSSAPVYIWMRLAK